jgi:hypothetical protein
MPRCVFCGRQEKLTGEHAFPDWLRRAVGDGGAQYGRRTSNGHIDRWQTIAYSTKVNDVCNLCNTGWMSDIENSVRNLLLPMIRSGFSVTMYQGTLKSVATWALLRSLILSCVTTQDDLPEDLYTSLEKTHVLSPRTSVWLGRLSGTDDRTAFFTGASLNITGTQPDTPDGWVATMAIGKVILRVFVLLKDRESGPVTHGRFEPYLLQVWPHRQVAAWPPEVLNLDLYKELARTIPGAWIAQQHLTK